MKIGAVLTATNLVSEYLSYLPTFIEAWRVALPAAAIYVVVVGTPADVPATWRARYAAHLLYTDRCVRAGRDLVSLAFHQFWMVAVISFIMAGAAGCPMGVAGLKGWGVIVFLAIFPTLIAFYIQMLAQKESEPFKVGLVFTFEPVFAAIFAWTWGGEKFIAVKAVGGFLIVSAMLLGELSKLNFKRPEPHIGDAA